MYCIQLTVYYCDKHTTKSNLGGNGLFHPKNQCPSLREAKAGIHCRYHGRMMRTSSLFLPCLATFPMQPKPTCPRMTWLTVGWMLLYQVVISIYSAECSTSYWL